MKKIDGWESIQAPRDFEPLPLGAYVMRIMGAAEKEFSGFSMLEISLDVAEGDFKDFYATDYRAQPEATKKWHGVLRLFVPTGDGSDKDKWSAARLKGAFEAIEASNPGYKWDWREESLKGKLVGCLYRNEEWRRADGTTSWSARPFRLIEAAKVRDGSFKLPKDKPLSGGSRANSKNVDVIPDDLPDDLPF